MVATKIFENDSRHECIPSRSCHCSHFHSSAHAFIRHFNQHVSVVADEVQIRKAMRACGSGPHCIMHLSVAVRYQRFSHVAPQVSYLPPSNVTL